jgi:hypothetical protein|tara:strand:- start:2009 stop:2407 length:399 start_codon:yes stop_codon:yes gene_type:complete
MKTLLTKDQLNTYLELNRVDFELKASTKKFFLEVHKDWDWEDYTSRHGNKQAQQLQAIKEVKAKIDGVFTSLCRLKNDGIINFRFKDVIDLVTNLELPQTKEYGFSELYLDGFYRELIRMVKSTHKIYATEA